MEYLLVILCSERLAPFLQLRVPVAVTHRGGGGSSGGSLEEQVALTQVQDAPPKEARPDRRKALAVV